MAESALATKPLVSQNLNPNNALARGPESSNVLKNPVSKESPAFDELKWRAFGQSIDALTARAGVVGRGTEPYEQRAALGMVMQSETLLSQALSHKEIGIQNAAFSQLGSMLEISTATGDRQLGDFAADMMHKNLIQIDGMFKGVGEKFFKHEIMKVTELAVRHLGQDVRTMMDSREHAQANNKRDEIHELTNFMVANYPDLLKITDPSKNEDMREAVTAIDTIIAYSGVDLESGVFNTLSNYLKTTDPEGYKKLFKVLSYLPASPSELNDNQRITVGKFSKRLIGELLNEVVGDEWWAIERGWSEGNQGFVENAQGEYVFDPLKSPKLKEKYQDRNLEAVMSLESARPGSVRILYDRFFIKNFSRYPLDLLIKQYDERDRSDLPYVEGERVQKFSEKTQSLVETVKTKPNENRQSSVRVVYSWEDNNGAFEQHGKILTNLAKQLEAHGIGMVITEAGGSPEEVQKQLIAVARQKGPAVAPIFGFHGSIESMRTSSSEHLSLSDLLALGQLKKNGKPFERSSGERLASFLFKAGAEGIFVSCSTGALNSIGDGMARTASQYGIEVHAPDKPAAPAAINLERVDDQGLPHFQVAFAHGAQDMHYKNGQLVDTEELSAAA